MQFSASGHQNISCNHKNTLEFTKDKHVTKNGDCIVAVNANFKKSKIKKLLKHGLLIATITTGKAKDQILFETNKDFDSDHEIVIRLSEHPSERTLGVRASKAAFYLDPELKHALSNPKTKVKIKIEPQIKLLIFDFDDTLEDWQKAMKYTHKHLAKDISKLIKLDRRRIRKMLDKIDHYYSHKGAGKSSKYFDRHLWFSELFKKMKIKHDKSDVEKIVKKYWNYANNHAELVSGMHIFLKHAQTKFKIAVISDSDGKKSIKLDRMRKCKALKYFDYVITSDDTRQNKPSMKYYHKVLKKFKVKPEECIMIGDKPEVDLLLAKQLGMITVWIKHGSWAEHEKNKKPFYVDFKSASAEHLKHIIDHF